MAKWQKGVSGNPGGRPAGVPNPQARLRKAIAADLPDVIKALVERAKTGDPAAVKLVLDRVLPPLRPSDATVTLPAADTLAGQGQAVMDAVAAGTLPANVAASVMSALSGLAKIVETTELIERIERLEGKQ